MIRARHLTRVTLLTLVAAVALLTGCAQIQLGAPAPSVDNIQKAKAAGMAPVAVGEFGLAAGRDKAMDAGISMRSNTVSSPIQGSFAQYLKENLSTELRGAGLLDPASKTVISGKLTESVADASSSQGKGSLAAQFTVVRDGRNVYDKELRATSTWESSFVGAIAIPAAVSQYTALYRSLIGQLLDDPAFRSAVKR
jgi:hypothetical protein